MKTSWIWMKDAPPSDGFPCCDPVCPEDERLAVHDLIQTHRETIDGLKEAVATHPLYDATKHDDLFLLRFVLTHHKKAKSKKKAMAAMVKAVGNSLEFRKKYRLDEVDRRHIPPHLLTEKDEKLGGPLIKKYWDTRMRGESLVCVLPDRQRGCIILIDPSDMNVGTSEQGVLTKEMWNKAFALCNEFTFQWADYVTRTTGRLTKAIRVINMEGTSLKMIHRKDQKWDGDITSEMEDCYPQLVHSVFCCNAPSYINVLWGLIKAVLPKRMIEKFSIVNPKGNAADLAEIMKYISLENLPAVYGGKNDTPPSQWKL